MDNFRFDTGPMVAVTPESIAAPLRAVGEHLKDWMDIVPVEPICRAHYPDGATLDVFSDPHRTAAEIRTLCGGREARAYLRYRQYRHYAPCHVPPEMFFKNPRTLRLFDGKSLFGFSPLGTGWRPCGGTHAVAGALASACEKHGVSIRYQTRPRQWETRGGRIVAALTDDGDRLPADAVVVPRRESPKRVASLVLHLGSDMNYAKIAHRNVHFGKAWQRSKHELFARGELMRDPTALVSAPSRTDRTIAPAGQHVYEIVVPVPAALPWDSPSTRAYAGEIMATLEARGYLDLGASLRVSYLVTPADWARQGMNYGVPDRPVAAKNLVYAESGLEAGRQAAQQAVASRPRHRSVFVHAAGKPPFEGASA